MYIYTRIAIVAIEDAIRIICYKTKLKRRMVIPYVMKIFNLCSIMSYFDIQTIVQTLQTLMYSENETGAQILIKSNFN